jgi:hypothetical protein
MSTNENELGHGHSVASWSAVITAIVGVTVGTLGVVLPVDVLVVAGSILALIAIPLGPVLSKLGYGVKSTIPSSKK